MSRLWGNFKTKRLLAYELDRLIDRRVRHEFPRARGAFHTICDIDKTYLETRFESFVDILQVALETATAKQTVEGAADILMAIRWGNIYAKKQARLVNGLHFVSSSPPQLRSVLEEKLMIDGLEWDTDTFKNQAYNLLKGRVSYLRQHLAYKTAAIINIMRNCPEGSQFIFIGDNAESDAIIYLGITLYQAGVLDSNSYLEYLSAAGADPSTLVDFRKRLVALNQRKVAGIIIRNAPGYKRRIAQQMRPFIRSFNHFYETAFILNNIGVFDDEVLVKLTKDMHNYYGIDRSYLCSVIESAGVGRGEGYHKMLEKCLRVIKVDKNVSWKKDLSRDLSPFDFSGLREISAYDAIEFARCWHEPK